MQQRVPKAPDGAAQADTAHGVPGDAPLIDLAALEALAAGAGAEHMPNLLDGFLAELRGVEAALPSLTGEPLAEAVHSLKSISGTFGAQRLYQGAMRLDALCRELQGRPMPAEMHANIAELTEITAQTRIRLEELRRQ